MKEAGMSGREVVLAESSLVSENIGKIAPLGTMFSREKAATKQKRNAWSKPFIIQ